ncbi:MAG TPA: STAS domain-containing protein [Gaiellaceae bacterium]|jgi:anti-anti-sigma factor|nr:STAS domain-containing protein [Gaiellaceae bacterium]
MGKPPISVTVEKGQAVVTLRGEHEAYTADKLAKQVTALVDEGLAVTVDLRETAFVDSTVVGVLIAARRRADERGSAFRLLLGDETGWPVRRILEVTGLVDALS